MQKTRAQFKLALRFCKQHEEIIRAVAYATSLASHYITFWKDIREANNKKISSFAQVVDGCVGDDIIAEHWREHFEKLYNCNIDNDNKGKFYKLWSAGIQQNNGFSFTVQDVYKHISKQKCGKSPGLDGMSMEAITYGNVRLVVHICPLFNLFLKYG